MRRKDADYFYIERPNTRFGVIVPAAKKQQGFVLLQDKAREEECSNCATAPVGPELPPPSYQGCFVCRVKPEQKGANPTRIGLRFSVFSAHVCTGTALEKVRLRHSGAGGPFSHSNANSMAKPRMNEFSLGDEVSVIRSAAD